MSTTVIATDNQTSFAVAFADANALLLDGIALTGELRASRFERAKVRATHALGHVQDGNKPEEFLVRQLLAYIATAEQQRWNY